MKKCDICGHINDDTQLFCGQCGNKLTNTPPLNQFSQQPPIQNNSQQNTNYQYNSNPQGTYYQPPNNGYNPQQQYPPIIVEKKKSHGCLVTLAVFGVIFLLIIILGSCGSSTNKTTNSPEKEYVFNKSIIYNENDIKIEIIDSTITLTEINLNLYIENNSDNDYNISIQNYAINNIMIDSFYTTSITSNSIDFSALILDCDIASGKKSNCSLSISNSALDKYNIDEIQSITVMIEFRGNNNFKSKPIIIKTNKYNNDNQTSEKGNIIYSDKKFILSEIKHSNKSASFSLYNNDTNYLEYTLTYTSINNWAYDSNHTVFNKLVFPNCISIFSIEPDNDFFNQNKISKIDNIELKLDIRPNGARADEYSTPAIVVEFN